MLKKVLMAGALCALALVAVVHPARAGTNVTTLLGLNNTGNGTASTSLQKNIDPYYTYAYSSDFNNDLSVFATYNDVAITNTSSWPLNGGGGPYVSAPTGSNWISPQANYTNDSQNSDPVGYYAYQTSFQITNFNQGDLYAINLYGKWATDNPGVSIWLNGKNIYTPTGNQVPGYTALTPFYITGTTNVQNNDLTFVVKNEALPIGSTGGNPTALLVDFPTLSANTSQPIPEPEFFQLGTLLACGGFLGLFRKMRKASGSLA